VEGASENIRLVRHMSDSPTGDLRAGVAGSSVGNSPGEYFSILVCGDTESVRVHSGETQTSLREVVLEKFTSRHIAGDAGMKIVKDHTDDLVA
jgi:hypothetical protein